MNIDEAKKKQCRIFPHMAQMFCCANECMHWRWHEEFITDHQCETFLNEDGRLEYKPRSMLSKTSGYCGLSGKAGAQ